MKYVEIYNNIHFFFFLYRFITYDANIYTHDIIHDIYLWDESTTYEYIYMLNHNWLNKLSISANNTMGGRISLWAGFSCPGDVYKTGAVICLLQRKSYAGPYFVEWFDLLRKRGGICLRKSWCLKIIACLFVRCSVDVNFKLRCTY